MNDKRVVLDTNILVSALMSKHGNPAKILNMFLSGALVLIYCDEILNEYEDVLYRPRLHISANDADTVMAAVQQHVEKVLPEPSTNLCRMRCLSST